MSKDFIFKKNTNSIEFIGDFNGLYESEENPWEQSNYEDSSLFKYYKSSRDNLSKQIQKLNAKSGCEIGCGLGYVTDMLNKIIKFDGIDISNVAINKANKLFENIDFYTADIGDKKFSHKKNYDIVVLNQILWYILTNLDDVEKNINKILNKNGFLIISTLFLKNQQYGNDIIGSFDDLISYWISDSKYKVIHASIEYGNEDIYQDSILVLQKR